MDVLVTGAGPAGAATAWRLARSGRSVLLLDRAHFPRPKPCAEYVSPEAVRILSAMGLLERVLDAGAARLAGMRVRAPCGVVLTGEWAAAREFRGAHGQGIALRREVLDTLLVDAARAVGADVREGVRVRDVARDSHGRVGGVVLADGAVLRARLVVGADGLRSTIARRLELGGRARWPRRVAFVTHYAGVAGARTHGEMHVDAEGYVGLAQVDAGLTNVAVVVPAAGARDAAGGASAFIAKWIARRPHLAERFAAADAVGTALGTGPFAWRTRRAWAPGVALVGDAADFFDPFTGEGVYSALRGAELLAPFAVAACDAQSASAHIAALREYDRARRAAFRGKWMVERLVAVAVGSPPVMNRVARGLARRRDLADTLVGVTGDVVPATAVLRPGYAVALARAAFAARS